MSYQPRRAAELDPPMVAAEDPADGDVSGNPRRVANSRARLLRRGGVVLAAATVVATATTIVIGAAGVPAAALAPTSVAVTASASPLIAADLMITKPAPLAAAAVGEALALSRQYTTGSLNVRAEPNAEAELLGRLEMSVRVEATSQLEGEYRKVVFEEGFGWVLAASLSDSDASEVPEGTSMEPCSRGSSVEKKLRKTTILIYRSLCPRFQAVNSYGGWRSGGMQFHKNGRALDIMLTPRAESALGKRIAKYLIAHAAEFKIDHIIFEQHIWTPRSPRWRKMGDRGSLNANHFNHVHVAIKASAP